MEPIDNGKLYAIVTVFIGFIITSAVLVPIVIDMAFTDDMQDSDMRVGQTFTYEPEVNIPGAIISVSGDAMDYGTFEDGVIEIDWEETGTFTLIITATTAHPSQTATQTITFEISDKQTTDSVILLVVPTVLIIGLMLFALRRVGGMGIDVDGDARIGGSGSSLFGENRGGFGKR